MPSVRELIVSKSQDIALFLMKHEVFVNKGVKTRKNVWILYLSISLPSLPKEVEKEVNLLETLFLNFYIVHMKLNLNNLNMVTINRVLSDCNYKNVKLDSRKII